MNVLFIVLCVLSAIVSVRGDDFAVRTYGGIPSDGLMDTQAINSALNAASKVPNSRVIFEKGNYNINGTLNLATGTNLTIEGNGATIIGTVPVMVWYIQNCKGFTLRNMVLDWDPVPFTAGKVIANTKWSVDIEVAPGHVASNRTCEEITKYNGTTGYWYADTVFQQRTTKVPSILLDSNTMRIPFDNKTGGGWAGTYFTVGSDLVCRHLVYEAPAFTASVCQNVLIDNFIIYTAPGMGITAKHTTNLTVTNSQVTPRKPRWVSTTADGSHFLNMRGTLTVSNTVIQGMGDDCMNLHNDYFSVLDKNSTHAVLGYGIALGMDLVFVNDTIGFSTKSDPFNYFVLKTVKSNLRNFAAGLNNMTFYEGTDGIPVGGWATIMNTPYLHLNNYTAGFSKGRGIVLQTDGGALIENSNFTLTNGVAIDITCDVAAWGEGNCGSNVVIRNNKINYVNQKPFRNREIGDISIYAGLSSTVQSGPSTHSNITIEQNTFVGTILYAVNIASVNKVKVRGNKFQTAGNGVFTLCNATDVVVEYNSYMQVTSPNLTALVTFDGTCAPSSMTSNNNDFSRAFALAPATTAASSSTALGPATSATSSMQSTSGAATTSTDSSTTSAGLSTTSPGSSTPAPTTSSNPATTSSQDNAGSRVGGLMSLVLIILLFASM